MLVVIAGMMVEEGCYWKCALNWMLHRVLPRLLFLGKDHLAQDEQSIAPPELSCLHLQNLFIQCLDLDQGLAYGSYTIEVAYLEEAPQLYGHYKSFF